VSDCPESFLTPVDLVISETKRWDEIVVGDLVQIKQQHGPVVETNVDPLFCAHRFEDGSVITESRDREVATRRPADAQALAEWQAERRADWEKMPADFRRMWLDIEKVK